MILTDLKALTPPLNQSSMETKIGDVSSLDILVTWVQSRVSVKGFTQDNWTAQHDETVIDFVSNPTARRLLALVDKSGLFHLIGGDGGGDGSVSVSAEAKTLVVLPTTPTPTPTPPINYNDISEIGYFIRPENVDLSIDNIESVVQFGTIGGNSVHSLLRLMNGVFSAQIFKSSAWPDSVKKDFTGHYHRFMASLTETANAVSNKTVLYLPDDDISDVSSAAKNKDIVQQLESIVIHWTRQIKEVVNAHDNGMDGGEIAGPLEEINFWRSRTIDLSGISEQLHRNDVKRVVAVLETAKSSYLGPFQTLSQRIREGSLEAENNLK